VPWKKKCMYSHTIKQNKKPYSPGSKLPPKLYTVITQILEMFCSENWI